jgi:hypothetical protein
MPGTVATHIEEVTEFSKGINRGFYVTSRTSTKKPGPEQSGPGSPERRNGGGAYQVGRGAIAGGGVAG